MRYATLWPTALFLMAKPSQSWLQNHPLLPSLTIKHHQQPQSHQQPRHQPQNVLRRVCHQHSRLSMSSSPDSPPPPFVSTSLGTDEAAWKKEGERIIMKAATEAGANPEMITIDWKSGRLVVTVDGTAYIPADLSSESDVEEEDDDEFSENDMDMMDDGEEEDIDDDMIEDDGDFGDAFDDELDEDDFNPLENGFVEEVEEESTGVDVVSIARAVNAAFDEAGEGTIGYNIAVHHSIEVTTPGATDELSGIMFESYKGFGVILEFKDSKTGKTKKVEGKLIQRTPDFTQINERGRMRKFKNDLVVRVTLPKAKTEKGVNAKKSKKSKRKRK